MTGPESGTENRPAVCQMCLSPSWGGMEAWTVRWGETFRERGFPSYGVAYPGGRIGKKFLWENIPSLFLRPWGSRYVDPLASFRLRNFIKTNRIRFLFVHRSSDLWLVFPALFGMETKVVYFSRMFLGSFGKRDPLHRLVYSRVSRVVALSETAKGFLEKGLPVPPERIVVIPNGVDGRVFSPDLYPREATRKELGIPPDQEVVAVTGKLSPWKGQRELVQAVPSILKRHPNCLFLLVGDTREHSTYAEEVQALAVELKVSPEVRILGEREDVPKILAASDLFVMPSYEENFGNVLLEAMMMGKPCVATRSGGTPEILGGGRFGMLVEPRSPEALARGILEVLDNPDLRTGLGAAARRRAVEEYDLQAVASRLEALLKIL